MGDEDRTHASLIEVAKDSIGAYFDRFDDAEDDIRPEVTWRSGYGECGLGIMMLAVDLGEAETQRNMAMMIMCHLGAEQASEATFAHTVWAIDFDKKEQWEAEGRPLPADFSGRHEEVFLFHATPDGDALHRARITRYPDKPPTLGAWSIDESGGSIGPFRMALTRGIQMGRSIPADLAARLRDDMEKHGSEKVLAGMMASLDKALDRAQA